MAFDLRAFAAEWLGTWLVDRLCRSLRFEVAGDAALQAERECHGTVIGCSWHARMIGVLYQHRYQDACAIVSQHRDGELIARVLQRLGWTCVRGSTTRGGMRALAQLIRVVRQGRDIGFTPDGPRGPRYVAQVGAVYVAQKTGCPIIPVGFATRWYWEFNSWDRFRLPKPFSRAALHYGQAIHVPRDLEEADVETWRQRVEDGIRQVTREAEAAMGLPPEEGCDG